MSPRDFQSIILLFYNFQFCYSKTQLHKITEHWSLIFRFLEETLNLLLTPGSESLQIDLMWAVLPLILALRGPFQSVNAGSFFLNIFPV